MGRQQSSIDRLPEAAREQLNELLRDSTVTQKDAVIGINRILAELEHPEQLSKSAVNRYAVRMDAIGKRMRESREVADALIGKLGSQPQGKIGNLVNEILRSVSFELSLNLTDGDLGAEDAPAIAKTLKDLALTTMRLEKAANLNVEREKEIRKQALEDAAKKVDKLVKKGGLTAATVQTIRKEILGIA